MDRPCTWVVSAPSRAISVPLMISSSDPVFRLAIGLDDQVAGVGEVPREHRQACQPVTRAIFIGPTIGPRYRSTVRPTVVNSQLPPRSTARSTMTEPGSMHTRHFGVTRIGAFLPGTVAIQCPSLRGSLRDKRCAASDRCLRQVPWHSRPSSQHPHQRQRRILRRRFHLFSVAVRTSLRKRRSQALRRCNGLQSRNTHAKHEDLGRRHGARGRHHHREGPAKICRRINHHLVPGESLDCDERISIDRAREMRGINSMAKNDWPDLASASDPCGPVRVKARGHNRRPSSGSENGIGGRRTARPHRRRLSPASV